MTELIKTYFDTVSKPTLLLPALACDAHCHIFGPSDLFKYDPSRTFTPVDAPKEKLFALHELLGIQRCVIVQSALHGFDNAVVVDAMKARPAKYLGVALKPANTSFDELKVMEQQGFRAIRFNFMAHLKTADSIEDIISLTHRLAPIGMHLQVHFSSDLIHSLAPHLEKAVCPVVIDHIARVDAARGADHEDFKALVKLLKNPNFYVKVSGVDRISQSPPYLEGVNLAKILIDEFTDRCVWGTDWPHPNHHHIPDDAVLVDAIARIADTTEKIKKLMVDNPALLYRFA